MKRKRTKIPAYTEVAILFNSDRTCCLCRKSNSVQIHHLDGDPSNQEVHNLVVLCLVCHDTVTKKGGITRGYPSGYLRKVQDEWNDIVKVKRENSLRKIGVKNLSEKKILNSLAIHEIRKIRTVLSSLEDEEEYEYELNKLYAFTKEYGPSVRIELLGALSFSKALSFNTDESKNLIYTISCLVTETLLITSLVGRSKVRIPKEEKDIYLAVLNIGFEISYLGIRVKRNLDIVDAGARVLWTVLRFVGLNKIRVIEDVARERFSRLKEIAKSENLVDAYRWLDFMEQDALAIKAPLPKLPRDVENKLTR